MTDKIFVYVCGNPCFNHSVYKGYTIYRAFDPIHERPRMLYYAIGKGKTLSSCNLSGIRAAVTEEVNGCP